MSQRSNDPNGCYDDYENELYAEAMYAAHLDHECPPNCDWCEKEKDDDPNT